MGAPRGSKVLGAPMGQIHTSPARAGPSPSSNPMWGMHRATVEFAVTAAPGVSPESATSPEGRSTDSTNSSCCSIQSMQFDSGSRGGLFIPLPSIASMMRSLGAVSVGSGA